MSQLSNLFYLNTNGEYRQASTEIVIAAARVCMTSLLQREIELTSLQAVRDFLALKLGQADREIFAVLFLDSQNRLIEYREMFQGTLAQTSVYPREVVRASMQLNAAAVLLAHNHPSGTIQPSRADEQLTQTLRSALSLVDVRVLDHLIVAGGAVLSFAEQGLL